MSKAEAELQRQVNDYQQRLHVAENRCTNLQSENDVLRRNVADLQKQLHDCQKKQSE